ncbi:MAG: penicillin-binding protein 2 [Rugosibacter sp.]|jgi:cell division protein FtsI (penicillin-binding protein 3)|nr:cell division protein FtsI (penicillin-binding protein 3) [Rugosibacter sp.]
MKSVRFSRSPLLSQPLPLWRRRLVLLALLCGFVVLIGRAVYLQGINNEFLGDKGRARFERVLDISATRGRITDRHGAILAVSTPVRSVWAIPGDADLKPKETRDLAALLDLNVQDLNRKLASERDFVYLKRQLPPAVAEKVDALKLDGIHEKTEYRRYYPSGEVMAHMVGFTGVEGEGQEGVELAFDKQLLGQPGSRRVIKDRRGNVVEVVGGINPPTNGQDIALALDADIQYLAYTYLKQALEAHRAKAGGVVVLDAHTGEILALVNLPTYNPNNRVRLMGEQLRNRALTDRFEPGSTLKPFTIALALDKGKVHPETMIQTAPGRMMIGSATISDSHAHDALTVEQVIQVSSNVGAAKIALSMQPIDMWTMFANAGFGKPLQLGFPGEVGGHLRPAATWRPIEQATMSYGHGISVTLVQLARAYLAFARDGDLPDLSLLKQASAPTATKQLFTADTAHAVRKMLEMVVLPGGTAPRAEVSGYRVAGKTGTAHKLVNGRYANKYVASFAGFAPVSNPRLVIAVMIDEPSNGQYYGGQVAAPVFSQIMAGSLRSLGVPSDAPFKPLNNAAKNEPVQEVM